MSSCLIKGAISLRCRFFEAIVFGLGKGILDRRERGIKKNSYYYDNCQKDGSSQLRVWVVFAALDILTPEVKDLVVKTVHIRPRPTSECCLPCGANIYLEAHWI